MEDKLYTIKITEQQLAVIEAGLKELPGKICLPVLNALIKQLSEKADSDVEEVKKTKNSKK